MVTEKMVEAGLAALDGKTIDGRQFWTPEDRVLMHRAIEAALACDNTERRLTKLEGMGFKEAAKFARDATGSTGMIEPLSDEGSELCQDPIPGHER